MESPTTLRKVKPVKNGNSWGFRIPADFIENGDVSPKKEYTVVIIPSGRGERE